MQTKAEVSLEKPSDGVVITAVHLTLKERRSRGNQAKLDELAAKAKAGCPDSKPLNAKVTAASIVYRAVANWKVPTGTGTTAARTDTYHGHLRRLVTNDRRDRRRSSEQVVAGRGFYNYAYVDPGLEELRERR